MDFNFPKVELHLHVDGALRHQTVLELAQAKNITLTNPETGEHVSSCDGARALLVPKPPYDLDRMLQKFYIFMPCIVGDIEAMERIAYELCEDQAEQGVKYFEGRFSPHFLSSTQKSETMIFKMNHSMEATPHNATAAILRGLARGSRDFNTTARAILCCIRAHPQWNDHVLELAKEFKDQGVVGIDLAGCAHGGAAEDMDAHTAVVFKEAARHGLHRTVHAGESGDAKHVKDACDNLLAERIGHGYRVLKNGEIYSWARNTGIHFETCPTSSVLTGAVDLPWSQHPITSFASDNVNFGLNTDDPTVFGCLMNDELSLAHKEMALSKRQLWQCERCELLVGIQASSMQLELRNRDDEFVAKLADDSQTLEAAGVADGMTLHVIDSSKGQNGAPAAALLLDEQSDIPKYEMSDEAYANKSDSVRAFLQRNKMGKYGDENADAPSSMEEKCDIALNSRCEVRPGGRQTTMPKRATVRFVGETHFKPGVWVGVQYDEPLGKNDGLLQGRRYFTCPPNYGAFVRPADVTVGDFPELSIDDDIDEM